MYTTMLQVKNVPGPNDASAGPLELAGINVDFQGTERIDRSWISNSYAPSRGPVARDGKREVRPIIETPPARLIMQDYTLMLGESRMWLVRCARPLACPLSPYLSLCNACQMECRAKDAMAAQSPIWWYLRLQLRNGKEQSVCTSLLCWCCTHLWQVLHAATSDSSAMSCAQVPPA